MDLRDRGLVQPRGEDLHISIGWNRAKRWSWRIVVPIADDPNTFDFCVVAGVSVLMHGDRQYDLDRVAAAVLKFNPLRLIAVCAEFPSIIVYKAAL